MFPLAPLLAALAFATTPPGSATADRGAHLHVTRGATYRVAAVASSDAAAAGSYTLALVRTGRSGTSRTAQSGTFRLGPSGTDTLSVSRVNAGPGDVVRAELTVEWADGSESDDVFEDHVE